MTNTTNMNATATAKNNTKVTKKDYFNMLENLVRASNSPEKENLIKFIQHEIEQLNKKSTKKNSAIQQANENIISVILKVMGEFDRPVTISELLDDKRLQSYVVKEKDTEKTVKMSGQKLSALMTNLKKEERVIRTTEKKKAYFSLPKAE